MQEEQLTALMSKTIKEIQEAGIPIPVSDIHGPVLNKRAHSFLGRCKKVGTGYWIELSQDLMSASEESIREILFHELLHTAPECMNHGVLWKTYAEEINRRYGCRVTRLGHRQAHGLAERTLPPPQYTLICQSCGSRIERRRRSTVVLHPERYRCSRCGGRLKPLASRL